MEKELKYGQGLKFPAANTVLNILAFYFIFLFVFTGFSKLTDTQSLYTTLSNAPLFLNGFLASFLSLLIPITEIIIAAMLGYSKTRLVGWIGAILLLTAFTIYTGYIVMIAPNEPCTCGGLLALLSWKQHLVFNLVSLLLSFLGYHLAKRKT
ncbi:MauE/DoxX family redox-associated membrane protein [Autumnicola musiva]|uniref:Methylamine utilisation protein MauE domain-containing protein n=1 Tax=Autumnicola musiva TaxID=3075589 RepID=A0ABU3D6L8_9FLAO|nr:MauE/DoxX family redox-associated membrane protein [Zunongwangia sp. F117]MDT0677029.1 hypothetical protein [Zunongwangia sp. F117]